MLNIEEINAMSPKELKTANELMARKLMKNFVIKLAVGLAAVALGQYIANRIDASIPAED